MGIANTPYLLADNGLGDGDGIDCFVMPQEMSTPGISVIYATDFLDFRIDFSIDMPPNVTGFTWYIYSIYIYIYLSVVHTSTRILYRCILHHK